MIGHGPIGFFGKLPAQGDFVRQGVADGLVQRFARWLEEASEACYRAGTRLGAAPLRFAFRAAGEARVVVGAMRGSSDRVGRDFPLAVLVPLEGPALAGAFPALPAAYRGFLGAAEELLAGSERAALPQFAEGVRALTLPAVGELEAAAVRDRRAVEAAEGGAVLTRLLGDAGGGRPHYALRTFQAGCAKAKGREPSRAETVFDCPAETAEDLHLWLELGRRLLAWPAPPPFFWREGRGGRLLLSLGTPPAAVLPALAEPGRPSPKIWPLTTSQAAALESARKSLGPATAVLERGGATLGELLSALCR